MITVDQVNLEQVLSLPLIMHSLYYTSLLILIPFNAALRIKYQGKNQWCCTLIINLFIILNIRFYYTFIVVKGNQLLDAIVWYATTHAEGLYVIQLHNRNNVLWLAWVAAKGINENASKTSCDNEKVFYSCSKWRIGHSKGLEDLYLRMSSAFISIDIIPRHAIFPI